jgi:hypothetical protein
VNKEGGAEAALAFVSVCLSASALADKVRVGHGTAGGDRASHKFFFRVRKELARPVEEPTKPYVKLLSNLLDHAVPSNQTAALFPPAPRSNGDADNASCFGLGVSERLTCDAESLAELAVIFFISPHVCAPRQNSDA